MLRKVGLLALFLALTLLVSGAAEARPLLGSTRASESEYLAVFFLAVFNRGGPARKQKSQWRWLVRALVAGLVSGGIAAAAKILL